MEQKRLKFHDGPWMGWPLRASPTPAISDSKFLPEDSIEYLCPSPELDDRLGEEGRWKVVAALDEKSISKPKRRQRSYTWPHSNHYILSCTMVPGLQAVTSLSNSSYPSEYMRFFKDLLMVLTLSTVFYTCHLTRSVHSEIMGRVTLCLEQHLKNVFPELSPNKNSEEESQFRNTCSLMGCSLVYSFAFCLWPILESCDQQHNNFRHARKLYRGLLLVHQPEVPSTCVLKLCRKE